jgi:ATP-dependent DNA helicase DinG
MKPADLGLPAKFVNWRPGQDDAVIDTAVSLMGGQRFYVSAQPTGAGKSIYYTALAKLLGAKRTLILTITKTLQDQLESDFGSMGLVKIKGQNNYPCWALRPPSVGPGGVQYGGLHGLGPENGSCDDGPCHAAVECNLKAKGCAFFDQVAKAKAAEIVVSNYEYWMYSNKYGEEPIGEFDLLILDEAHDAPDKLADFVSVYISADELDDLLGCTLPPLDAGLEFWADWASEKHRLAEQELKEQKETKGSVSRIRRLRNLIGNLEDLKGAHKWKRGNPSKPDVFMPGMTTDWVAEPSGNGALFSPVWAHGYAEQFLFKEIKQIVLTSATIIPKTCTYLGLDFGKFLFNERPSTFPVDRRPIYVIEDAVKVGKNMSRGEELVWMNKIDAILQTRLDRKIIIHAVSYDRARFIYEHSRHRRHMVLHSSTNTAERVARFRSMAAPAILVSPSVKTGWDFPYDQCECQIIAKIPFADMRPAVIQARRKSDKKYLDYLALMSLIQSCGRGMRAADDFCETFIVDGNATWMLRRTRDMQPKFFKSAIRRITTVPAPPVGLRARRPHSTPAY